MAKKNPHAVALGRLGGKKGGKTRMAEMTEEERRAFAAKGGKAGAQARARKMALLSEEERKRRRREAALKGWKKRRGEGSVRGKKAA